MKNIADESSYRSALRRVSELIDLDPAFGTPDGDELDSLAKLVQAYEAEHYPMDGKPAAGVSDEG